ncbi:MAG: hypothetical protein A3F31_00025 [Candidatus Levybacteria bacterium RIFCSPHIGHO2_12_FULL_38_12]|nr:MAG: hypothetical protein A3F31_00025 [Candidatus Levybacteria bacterium RIFCSPHIGHO2_12_FULL_38_12]OGH34599.1 MAG: hypothetical protein A3A47_01560 [Candidatus Levybacteria bacterium RIFCSPLOWO2_01_FULL_37_20]OGH43426.1 MAG: hypothetical protein A3J14_04480 [Candidatus Levybacteria bacterium RIFCSPLOWO2_02_FULL_37_18]OGH51178.1 MAG: hypothetical protein A3G13_00015 [Candidatus Levybacteria bacterium RIFCSPLOWO2_12_FULL_37_7]
MIYHSIVYIGLQVVVGNTGCCGKSPKYDFNLIDLRQDILRRALENPTDDLEDNIQLHSTAEAACDFFLTLDRKLLKLKFFGKTRLVSSLSTD